MYLLYLLFSSKFTVNNIIKVIKPNELEFASCKVKGELMCYISGYNLYSDQKKNCEYNSLDMQPMISRRESRNWFTLLLFTIKQIRFYYLSNEWMCHEMYKFSTYDCSWGSRPEIIIREMNHVDIQ